MVRLVRLAPPVVFCLLLPPVFAARNHPVAAFLFRTTYEYAGQTATEDTEEEAGPKRNNKRKRVRRIRPDRRDRKLDKKPLAELYGVQTRNGVSYCDARTVDPGFFWRSVDGERPTIVRGAIWPEDVKAATAKTDDGEDATAAGSSALMETCAERWTQQLFERFANHEVHFQIRSIDETDPLTSSVETHAASFGDFVNAAFNSSHRSSMYMLDEDLLMEAPDLADELKLPERLWPFDLFDLFPSPIRPKKPCLIIGGAAARSMLHADPFEWTGWNYLVEGAKLWTFFPPDHDETDGENDQILEAARQENTAWDNGRFNVSAGWSSDVDLYHRRVVGKSLDWPSAAALGVMPAVARQYAVSHIRNTSEVSHQFEPSRPLSLTSSAGISARDTSPATKRRVSVLQQEGELLLIPPRWWHQTYHLEPCVAVAGQYMNPKNERQVLTHMLEWAGAEGTKLPEGTGGGLEHALTPEDAEAARSRILGVLKTALRSHHGRESGDELFEELSTCDD